MKARQYTGWIVWGVFVVVLLACLYQQRHGIWGTGEGGTEGSENKIVFRSPVHVDEGPRESFESMLRLCENGEWSDANKYFSDSFLAIMSGGSKPVSQMMHEASGGFEIIRVENYPDYTSIYTRERNTGERLEFMMRDAGDYWVVFLTL